MTERPANRRFHTLDVFTQTPLAGNPLAVVHDSAGLDTAAMQALAGEFNLSETVFVLPEAAAGHRAGIRIFTPGYEMAFAGHPTVGTAVLLASLDGLAPGAQTQFVLGEKAGPVPCRVRRDTAGRFHAEFDAPRLPEHVGEAPDVPTLAGILGIEPRDIGFAQHTAARYRAPGTFCFVPVRTRAALDAVRLDVRVLHDALSALGDERPAVFAYCRDTVDPAARFHARMFAPGLGITEDPATGSAVAAFAGMLMRFEPPDDGETRLLIEQGFAMGRPSVLELVLTVRDGRLERMAIGGGAVLVTAGEILV